jgi:catalase
VSYEPNSLASGKELRVDGNAGGFQSQPDEMGSPKTRKRSPALDDHFSQASLFWNSQGPGERDHIIGAFQHELWKVRVPAVRQRVVDNLAHVDSRLARKVAEPLGIAAPDAKAAAGRAGYRDQRSKLPLDAAASLGGDEEASHSIATRRIAVLVAPGVEVGALRAIQVALKEADAVCCVLAEHIGSVATASGQQLQVDDTFCSVPSVLFDAVLIPGGAASVQALAAQGCAVQFVLEAYKHCKAICAIGEGSQMLRPLGLDDPEAAANVPGIVMGRNDPPARAQLVQDFLAAIARHRHWTRPHLERVPA